MHVSGKYRINKLPDHWSVLRLHFKMNMFGFFCKSRDQNDTSSSNVISSSSSSSRILVAAVIVSALCDLIRGGVGGGRRTGRSRCCCLAAKTENSLAVYFGCIYF